MLYITYKEKAEKRKFLKSIGKKFASALNQKITPAELRLHNELSCEGIPFIFQKVVVTYEDQEFKMFIPDFFIKKRYGSLVVEVDGGYHNETEQKKKDYYRKLRLKGHLRHCKFLRFTNQEVLEDPKRVMYKIKSNYYGNFKDLTPKPNNQYVFTPKVVVRKQYEKTYCKA